MDIERDILPSMLLAPSAHNTQPWQFEVKDTVIDVYIDWSRHLSVSDPTRRELHVSLGCLIFNGRVAAAHAGAATVVSYFPNGEGKEVPVARMTFSEGQAEAGVANVYPAIAARRTDRSLYDSAPLKPQEREALLVGENGAAVHVVEDREKIRRLAALTQQGTENTLSRKDFKGELSKWVRNDWTRRGDGMPGYAW